MTSPEPIDLLKAVSDPLRLAVLGASVNEPASLTEIAEQHGVPVKKFAEAVGYLRTAGFLDERAVLDTDAIRAVGKQLPRASTNSDDPIEGPWTAAEALTLGRFFSNGRLQRIPSNATKRRLVLEKMAQDFEPGRRYDERDVNFMIQLVYHDYAAIRRYMVEEGFMDRADGSYWRTGGRFAPPPETEDIGGRRIPTSIGGVELRSYDASMVSALVEAADDSRIPVYMGDQFPYPYTTAAAEDWVEIATNGPNAAVQFAIFVDGKLSGGCGAFAMKEENTGSAEIGWWLNPDHWGRGVTTACVAALIDELFTNHGFMRLWAPVMAPHGASAAVAIKAGMHREGVARSSYLKAGVRYDQVNHGITRSDWAVLRTGRST
ncbi:MAG: GNAT family N-acetyltransferase [Acidimicrobiia bacterium]